MIHSRAMWVDFLLERSGEFLVFSSAPCTSGARHLIGDVKSPHHRSARLQPGTSSIIQHSTFNFQLSTFELPPWPVPANQGERRTFSTYVSAALKGSAPVGKFSRNRFRTGTG